MEGFTLIIRIRYSAALQTLPSEGESSGGKITREILNPSGKESFIKSIKFFGAFLSNSKNISTGSFNATTPAGSSGAKLIFALGENPCVMVNFKPALDAERENI